MKANRFLAIRSSATLAAFAAVLASARTGLNVGTEVETDNIPSPTRAVLRRRPKGAQNPAGSKLWRKATEGKL
jgi:hypothetical protein